MEQSERTAHESRLYGQASLLALITIIYNAVEGIVSVWLGLSDESLTLFGFGVDSFVEVVSGMGIWHMVRRIRRSTDEGPDRFERTALRVTGSGFYVLTAGLAVTAVTNLYRGHRPETTFWGIVISVVSMAAMWLLIRYKVKVGNRLNSAAVLADAACSRACLLLSAVLFAASAGYELTRAGDIDALGTMVIAVLCFREGREAFEKARAKSVACSCCGPCGGP